MRRIILIAFFYLLAAQSNLLCWEPEQMNALFKHAETLYEQGKYKEAIGEFQEFLGLYPDNGLVAVYIQRAEEKMRLESVLLKKEIAEDNKLYSYESARDKVKVKRERHLVAQKQKQEIRAYKEQSRLSRDKFQEELGASRIQAELAKKQEILKANQLLFKKIVEARAEKEIRKKARRQEKGKAQAQKKEALAKAKLEKEQEAAMQEAKRREELASQDKAKQEKLALLKQERVRRQVDQKLEKELLAKAKKDELNQKRNAEEERIARLNQEKSKRLAGDRLKKEFLAKAAEDRVNQLKEDKYRNLTEQKTKKGLLAKAEQEKVVIQAQIDVMEKLAKAEMKKEAAAREAEKITGLPAQKKIKETIRIRLKLGPQESS